ncbi:MAG: dimethyl sulfoxide reductase anchor subunit family protein, partial [Gammaproteobacteria bacterium]
MNPAYSVIFFTTATGAGYGLLILLALLAAGGLIPSQTGFGIAAFATSLTLVTGGLLASTVHLGHPERAWRALSQWRTSWLSREGLAAILTYVPVVIYAFGWVVFGSNDGAWAWIGVIGSASAIVTLICTAMIYASLKPVPHWHNAWVVPVYVSMALATGGVMLNFLLHVSGLGAAWMIWLAAGVIISAWAIRLGYWRNIDTARRGSSAGTATGLGHFGEVRQLESPHTSENFVMREMGFRIARRHSQRLRRMALVIGGALPLGLLLIALVIPATGATFALATSVAAAIVGVLIERWLFFAEARHVVTLYYGDNTPDASARPRPLGSG